MPGPEYNRYAPDEQMFATDEVLEPNVNYLHFMRELVEKGKFKEDMAAEVIVFTPKMTRQEHMASEGSD